jgi:hypothetical protein
MGFLRHIEACNRHDRSGFRPFAVDGQAIGWVRPALAADLPGIDTAFVFDGATVTFAAEAADFEARSQAFARAGEELRRRGHVAALRGEFFPGLSAWGTAPLFKIDRALVTLFGLKAFGLHVNGYVRQPDGSLAMWIGIRANDRLVAPGQFDNLIAGGHPHGLTLARNLLKEAKEEAGFGPEIAGRSRPVGVLTYTMETAKGLKPDTMFLYDLELAAHEVPENSDGEVERFELWPLDRVAESLRTSDNWKFNVPLVVLDFLIRHGWFQPDDPDYVTLANGLHR